MHPWSRSEFEPGSEETLDALHALLPETEEIDLADELHAEQFARWVEGRLRAAGLLDPVEEYDDPPAGVAQEPEDPPSAGQVLGMLEHLLGATPIDE